MTAEDRWLTGGLVVVGTLAVVSTLGPEADAVVTGIVTVVMGLGALACLAAYRIHVLRIRREIERRGGTVVRRTADPPRTARRDVCPEAPRTRRTRRPVVTCGRGRRRYR